MAEVVRGTTATSRGPVMDGGEVGVIGRPRRRPQLSSSSTLAQARPLPMISCVAEMHVAGGALCGRGPLAQARPLQMISCVAEIHVAGGALCGRGRGRGALEQLRSLPITMTGGGAPCEVNGLARLL